MEENCPYCGAEVEINHDDGYGYDEDKTYEQECPHCEKIFCYNTCISFSYDLFEAPCKNGDPHKLKEIHGHPKEFFEYVRRCEYCGEEVILDEEKHKKSCKKYYDDELQKLLKEKQNENSKRNI